MHMMTSFSMMILSFTFSLVQPHTRANVAVFAASAQVAILIASGCAKASVHSQAIPPRKSPRFLCR